MKSVQAACAGVLVVGLGCMAAVFARADNLTETEAELLKVVSIHELDVRFGGGFEASQR